MGYYDPEDFNDDYEYSYEKGVDETKAHCKEWVQGIVDQLYGFEDFNPDRLEHYLEELCHIVKVKLPEHQTLRRAM